MNRRKRDIAQNVAAVILMVVLSVAVIAAAVAALGGVTWLAVTAWTAVFSV